MNGGRGRERPAGEERTKGEIQERGREPEDHRGLGVGSGESSTPGAARQAGQGHTLQRSAPWTGLSAGGRGPHPSRGRPEEKKKKNRATRRWPRPASVTAALSSPVAPVHQVLTREGSKQYHLCPSFAPNARGVALPSLARTWGYHPAGHPFF